MARKTSSVSSTICARCGAVGARLNDGGWCSTCIEEMRELVSRAKNRANGGAKATTKVQPKAIEKVEAPKIETTLDSIINGTQPEPKIEVKPEPKLIGTNGAAQIIEKPATRQPATLINDNGVQYDFKPIEEDEVEIVFTGPRSTMRKTVGRQEAVELFKRLRSKGYMIW